MKNVSKDKIIKQEKGAVTALVLFTILMFVTILIGTYIGISINQKAQLKSDIRIQELYERDVSEINTVYIAQNASINDGYNNEKNVNGPKLLEGMRAIKFIMPKDNKKGDAIPSHEDNDWYDYGVNYEDRRWANAQTEDGSMWVWIPRYAYRINETEGKVDVKFLIGTTDYYFDDSGELQKAQRATVENLNIDTKGEAYTVHPAFTDESLVNFVNGGWDKELTGIWVAKFEAGYAQGNNDADVVASEEFYDNNNMVYVAGVERPRNEDGTTKSDGGETARNWVDGIYGDEMENGQKISIKYPTFQPLTYSMNYVSTSEAYRISKALTGNDNIYGFDSEETDSHLMKNSEWGAVAYLTQSIYGKNSEMTVNNASLNNANANGVNQPRTEENGQTEEPYSVYAVTGCTSDSTDAQSIITTIDALNNVSANTATTEGLYVWNQSNGQNASTTGNIYGIYDLSGGLWEITASFVSNGNENINTYAKSLKEETGAITGENGANTGTSTKYVTVYPSNDAGITDDSIASRANYKNYANNSSIYGDAIREVTDEKAGSDSGESEWIRSAGTIFGTTYKDNSHFPGYVAPIFSRGGRWSITSNAGVFAFGHSTSGKGFYYGFRPVLVAN